MRLHATHLSFFFNATGTPEIYTLSLHDALPISHAVHALTVVPNRGGGEPEETVAGVHLVRDRKSTRLNSSHQISSYAVFCLKKKTPSPHRATTARTAAPGATGVFRSYSTVCPRP